MKVLVIGSRNQKKRQEIVDLLADLPIEIRDLNDWPDTPEVVEDGDTFKDNACKKAIENAKHINHWVLSEDSGLVLPGLGGRPGVYSARYAGTQGDDEANNEKLIAEVTPLPEKKRAAYYVCVAALANPEGEVVVTTEARCNGVIVPERRGTNGFGYDPLFLIPEYHRTFGEMPPAVKRALSHRGKALAQMRPHLRKHLAD